MRTFNGRLYARVGSYTTKEEARKAAKKIIGTYALNYPVTRYRVIQEKNRINGKIYWALYTNSDYRAR